MNFPSSHPAHQGCQWNGGGQSPAMAEAHVVLVIDSDVPWIPKDNKPAKGAKIDVDPLKEQMPLFYIPAQRRYKADAETALTQILEVLERAKVDEKVVGERLQYLANRHNKRIQNLDKLEALSDKIITTPMLMGAFRKLVPEHSTLMIEVSFPGPVFSSPNFR
jgi:acetolactate synthase I/II/III large subunit